jgi:hypothetical protein
LLLFLFLTTSRATTFKVSYIIGGVSHGTRESLLTMGKFFLTMRLKGNTDLTIGCTHYNFSCHCLHLSFFTSFLVYPSSSSSTSFLVYPSSSFFVSFCCFQLFVTSSYYDRRRTNAGAILVGEQTPDLRSSSQILSIEPFLLSFWAWAHRRRATAGEFRSSSPASSIDFFRKPCNLPLSTCSKPNRNGPYCSFNVNHANCFHG